jgi:hypothetical protein
MNEYLLLMHGGTPEGRRERDADEWAVYFAKLRKAGVFQGGSAIGDGVCMSKSSSTPGITAHLVGYIRVRAESLAEARELVTGNPVFEAGGVVEIRELPRS